MDISLPSPWRKTGDYAVGGLVEVGYAPDSDLLLVLSSYGRGIFDVVTGERVARDRTEEYPMDSVSLAAPGFDMLDGVTVRTAGLSGGGLPLGTTDGWGLMVLPLPFTRNGRYLVDHEISLEHGDVEGKVVVYRSTICELRACGFSETGNSFVIAESCDLQLFARVPEEPVQ
jgi:hypothetical protein